MKTAFTTAALLCTTLILAPQAKASALPEREVRIDQERLEKLALEDQKRVLEIKDRLETILATDRSELDKTQRHELRGEWKELKSEMKEYNRNGNVVYISTGALIIIVLLLIIIL